MALCEDVCFPMLLFKYPIYNIPNYPYSAVNISLYLFAFSEKKNTKSPIYLNLPCPLLKPIEIVQSWLYIFSDQGQTSTIHPSISCRLCDGGSRGQHSKQ